MIRALRSRTARFRRLCVAAIFGASVTLGLCLLALNLIATHILKRDIDFWRASLAQQGLTLEYREPRSRLRPFGARLELSTVSLAAGRPDVSATALLADDVTLSASLFHPHRVSFSAARCAASLGSRAEAAHAVGAMLLGEIGWTEKQATIRYKAGQLVLSATAVPGQEVLLAAVKGKAEIRRHPLADATLVALVMTARHGSLPAGSGWAASLLGTSSGDTFHDIAVSAALLTPPDRDTENTIDRILVQDATLRAGPLTIELRGKLLWPSLNGDMGLHLTGVRQTLQEAIDHPPAALRQGEMPELARALDRLRTAIPRLPDSLEVGTTILAGRPNIDLSRLETLLGGLSPDAARATSLPSP